MSEGTIPSSSYDEGSKSNNKNNNNNKAFSPKQVGVG